MSNSNNSSTNSSINSDSTNTTSTVTDKNKLLYQEDFNKGETVLCYHGPLLYEAKCIKAEMRNKTPHYLIHYSGWNKSWDEWVSCPRVLKYSEENLKKQQELLATHGTSKILSKIKSNTRKSVVNDKQSDSGDGDKLDSHLNVSVASPSSLKTNLTLGSGSSTESKKKKQKIDSSDDQDDYTIKSDIVIKLTDELKQVLIDDNQNITINNKLVNIPASNTIQSILDDYKEFKIEKQFDKDVITATVEGIKDYFNSALPTKLLYKTEKLQYVDFFKNTSKKPSQIYGSIHLLRLLSKIGEFLSYTYWDEISIKQLTLHIEDVIKYLTENRQTLYHSKLYINASTSYLQKCTNVTSTGVNSSKD